MRDYGRVFVAFWQSPEIRALPEDSRTLALYLLTSPHANMIGCFRMPLAYAADDLQWPIERVSEGFRNLCGSPFATVDEGTRWVLIHKYIKWNGFENPNVAKAAHRAFDQVPCGELKSLLAKAILEFGEHLSEPFRNGCETVSKPYRNPEPEPEPEPIPEPEPKTHTARKRATLSVADLIADGVEEDHARDWLKARGKVPLTQTAWDAVKRESERAHIPHSQAVRIAAENGWRGFKADWASNGHNGSKPSKPAWLADREARMAEFTGQSKEIIDAATRRLD